MITNYTEMVEKVKSLSREDKEELKFLIEKFLIKEQRDEILLNFKKSKNENLECKLKFSSNLDELKRLIDQ